MERSVVAEAPTGVRDVTRSRQRAAHDGARARASAFWELTKPRITRLVLVTAAAGFYLAGPGSFDLLLLANALLGIALAAGGSGALNQYMERDADARMQRTSQRPLPSGRVRPAEALIFGMTLSVLGVMHLVLFVGPVPAAIVVATIISYICVYTPLKRRTWLATIVGAVPGALPILAGWTAAGGRLDLPATSLFAIMFVWQMPHFFALAWVFREDYERGGFRMLSAGDMGGRRTGRHVLGYALALLPVSLVPAALGMAGLTYAVAALGLGAAFTVLAISLLVERTTRRAWRVFFGSVVYLPVLLLVMILDKAIVG